MRRDLVWLKERKESRLQDTEKKMELSTVIDDAEKAKGKKSGFHLKELALGWWIDIKSKCQRN